jgi:hypothetical protein
MKEGARDGRRDWEEVLDPGREEAVAASGIGRRRRKGVAAAAGRKRIRG